MTWLLSNFHYYIDNNFLSIVYFYIMLFAKKFSNRKPAGKSEVFFAPVNQKWLATVLIQHFMYNLLAVMFSWFFVHVIMYVVRVVKQEKIITIIHDYTKQVGIQKKNTHDDIPNPSIHPYYKKERLGSTF